MNRTDRLNTTSPTFGLSNLTRFPVGRPRLPRWGTWLGLATAAAVAVQAVELGSAEPVEPVEAELPTLVVQGVKMPFDAYGLQWRTAVGRGLATLLITELSQQGKFQVLESEGVVDIDGENRIRGDEGRFDGADFMLYTELIDAGHSTGPRKKLFLSPITGIFKGREQVTRVEMAWRLVQLPNRRIVATGRSQGEEVGKASVWDPDTNENYLQSKEFRESAMGKALRKTIVAVATEVSQAKLPSASRTKPTVTPRPTPTSEPAEAPAVSVVGEVMSTLPNGVVIVSLGSDQGLKMGDRLQLLEAVDLKDAAGQVVFTEEKVIGEVVVEAVNTSRSKAVYTGEGVPRAGCKVKRI